MLEKFKDMSDMFLITVLKGHSGWCGEQIRRSGLG